ncbi:hypothetical protein F511_11943 [Dorcoceras hygrometricum]|uniref:Uncharacterized protein n=1 Tax=Dorcoceras hygrometricum TaxID=472368 RepID=A0A2Z7CKX2_9LAMI|nr:hypothetical protein F511_11943 [Dorcoceras hygrometricum]
MRSRLQPNTGSQRIPRTTQQLESEQETVATMCVSIWELPTRLSTRTMCIIIAQPAVAQHMRGLLCNKYYKQGPSNTDLTPAKPNTKQLLKNRNTEKQQLGSTNSTSAHPTLLTQQKDLTKHKLQANVRNQYPDKASQQEESNATTLTSIGVVYRRQ